MSSDLNNEKCTAMTTLRKPEPKVDITIRVATVADMPFIMDLQKRHAKNLGHLARPAIETYVTDEDVLVAESRPGDNAGAGELLGYIIFKDCYFRHEDIGIIYQVNLVPGRSGG